MRVQLEDGGGGLLFPKYDGRYLIDIGLGRFTGLVTAGSIFTMRNAATRHCRIHQVALCVGFAGTTAASAQVVQLKRFSTATPSGGTAITLPAGAVKNENVVMRNSTLVDARYADITGTSPLTVTNVVFEPSCGSIVIPRSSGGGATSLVVTWFAPDELHLSADEGLALVTTATAVVGDCITGFIEWSEK